MIKLKMDLIIPFVYPNMLWIKKVVCFLMQFLNLKPHSDIH